VLTPGLIAHSTNVVEHPDLVAERLLRYADIVGRDGVMAGTGCGFSQSPLAGRVHRSIMWAKLKCLAEGAAIASKLLWHDLRVNGSYKGRRHLRWTTFHPAWLFTTPRKLSPSGRPRTQTQPGPPAGQRDNQGQCLIVAPRQTIPLTALHDHHNAAIMPMPRHHASHRDRRAFSSRSPRYK
jgi:hypothetical protein